MSREVYIAGAAMTPFARHDGLSVQDLAQAAVLSALGDADVGQERIQALYNANVYGGMVLGQVLMRDLGITGPAVYNVENACASGATAVHLACQALRLGKCVFGLARAASIRLIPRSAQGSQPMPATRCRGSSASISPVRSKRLERAWRAGAPATKSTA
jgi:acetyl-CoA acetyltransferase